jgi:hypothetical protein
MRAAEQVSGTVHFLPLERAHALEADQRGNMGLVLERSAPRKGNKEPTAIVAAVSRESAMQELQRPLRSFRRVSHDMDRSRPVRKESSFLQILNGVRQ